MNWDLKNQSFDYFDTTMLELERTKYKTDRKNNASKTLNMVLDYNAPNKSK